MHFYILLWINTSPKLPYLKMQFSQTYFFEKSSTNSEYLDGSKEYWKGKFFFCISRLSYLIYLLKFVVSNQTKNKCMPASLILNIFFSFSIFLEQI